MAIDLRWGEFIYSHHALVLPVFSHAGLLCAAQYRALTHGPAVSAQVLQRKYKTELKGSARARRGANGFPFVRAPSAGVNSSCQCEVTSPWEYRTFCVGTKRSRE